MMKRMITTLFCAALIGGGNAALATEFAKPSIEIADAEELKGIKKVAVTSFTVQYVTEQVWDTAHYSGGHLQTTGQGGGFHAQLDPAKMQSTTDALYKEFVNNLQAAGFDVVSPEQLSTTPSYQTFLSKGPKTPRTEEAEAQSGNGAGAITSTFYTPSGMTMVVDSKIDYLKSGMMSQVEDPTLTFTGRLGLYTANLPFHDEAVQEELDAATLHVRIYVPLAKVDVKTGNILGHGYSNKTIEPGLRLGERFTRVSVGHKGDYAKMYLKEPLLIPGVIDSKVEEVKHPNPIRAMMGETYKIYPATMKESAYWTLMPEASSHALKAFIARLKESI